MITRAESGIVGNGIECHVCIGDGGICTEESDGGTVINCGEGVETCLLATGRGFTGKDRGFALNFLCIVIANLIFTYWF